MKKDDAKKLLPIIEAYGNGEDIEWFDGHIWQDRIFISFSDKPENYRIKPEPKLVPFTFEDAEFLIGKPIRSKQKDVVLLIQVVYQKSIMMHGFDTISYYLLLQNWEFLDGSPCGKYINE